ncbi:hypothetical protein B566_EDAN011245, partial [Ephemera danica]
MVTTLKMKRVPFTLCTWGVAVVVDKFWPTFVGC